MSERGEHGESGKSLYDIIRDLDGIFSKMESEWVTLTDILKE
jgi:hypothetical protein